MPDDSTVNMFWHGPRPSPLNWACMRSFLDRGHRLRVFSYEDLEIPQGALQADAREILPRDALSDDPRMMATFSDHFRYTILQKCGGWWADTDVYCLTERLPPEPYAWAEQEPGVV